jgi:hypothetical protein
MRIKEKKNNIKEFQPRKTKINMVQNIKLPTTKENSSFKIKSR